MPEMILVVDDDPDIARFVEVNLRSAGFDVAVATDGEEALRRAEEIRPDLVLLDVMMPRVDGFEVAQRLRRNTRTANTCSTGVSGFSPSPTRNSCFRARAMVSPGSSMASMWQVTMSVPAAWKSSNSLCGVSIMRWQCRGSRV